MFPLKQSLVFCLLLAFVLGDHAEWEQFKKKHGKRFRNGDHEHSRHKAFNKSLEHINRHNTEAAQGLHTYTLGINEHSDLTDDEKKSLRGFKGNLRGKGEVRAISTDRALPASVNWTAQGYVTPVKNQGQCGDCWAFSSAGAIEGLLFKTTKTLVSLSPQNLADCVYPGQDGCNGGIMESAFQYVIQNRGIASDAKYPYTSGTTQTATTCKYGSGPAAATVKSYAFVNATEAALQTAVATVGPISVAIDASPDGFMSYRSGIYQPTSFSGLDHAVLLVGYGTENNVDYWLVKNSWGTTWGINGYVKIVRNKNNAAGIASHAVYPTN